MIPYHDQQTFREKIASQFYRLPKLPKPLEIFVIVYIISPLEGKNPHWKHLGKNCPCLTESIKGET